MRMSIVIPLLASAIALSACGKKGPLYLPDDKSAYKPASHDQTLRLQSSQSFQEKS